jgi:serine/threonine protein kinase
MSVETIFATASQKPSSERAAYLAEACGADSELRRKVERLLRAHDAAEGFLDSPATSDRTGNYTPIAETIGTKVGPYILREQIGEGGFGLVFVAEQTEPVKRKVALKVIKPGMDSHQVIARFEAERQALALMDHPNIARVLDAGATDSGRPYFVMELVRGIPITEYCDKNQLPPRERLDLFITVCQAIQHAHQKGIIHRDVKPSNVLVTSHDGKPVAKVIDFGVAKAIHQQLTERTIYTNFAQMVGTPLYMSPEQAEMSGLDIDTRSDIYSLGVLLYELLTGTTPLEKKRLREAAYDEIRRLIREEEPSKPSTRLSTSDSIASVAAQRKTEPAKLSKLLQGDLDWITMKALEKDRTRRYETASGLARDVQRYLTDEPVEACPPSATYRLRKFARKNRTMLTTAVAIAALLIAGAGVSIWQALRAKQAESLAQKAAEAERQSKLDVQASAAAEKEAKIQAQKNLEQAKSNLAFAKKGNEILGSIFAGLKPEKIAESGRPLQDVLRENLGKAVKDLEGSAIGDPLEVANMQNTLGMSLLALGEFKQSVDVLGKSLETRKSVLGTEHHDTVESMNNLALAYQDDGKVDKALPLIEQAYQVLKATHGPEHPDTLTSMDNLAEAYKDTGKVGLALPLAEETLKLRKSKLGAEHPDTLISMNNLAGIYQDAGKLDLAVALYEESLRINKAVRGASQPEPLTAMSNLALAYKVTGKLDKALPLYEETLKGKIKILGAEHPDTLNTMNNLAAAYDAAGKLDLELPLHEKVFRLRKAKLGADHPSTLASMSNLATAYQNGGKLNLAVPMFVENFELTKNKLGADHPQTLLSMHNLAAAYHVAGKLDLALPLYLETLQLRKAKLGDDHPDTLASMNNLASWYWKAGKLEMSLHLFEEILPRVEKKFGRDHPLTQTTIASLGVAYKDAGRLGEALPLLEEASRSSSKYPKLGEFRSQLLDGYVKARNSKAAEGLVSQLIAEDRKRLPKDSPQLAGSFANYGQALLRVKAYSQAEPLLRECLGIREKKEPEDWRTFNAQSMLGGALLGEKKYPEAEPLLLKGYEGMKAREKAIPKSGGAESRIPEALDRLIQLYSETNKPDEVKRWQAERMKYLQTKKDAE